MAALAISLTAGLAVAIVSFLALQAVLARRDREKGLARAAAAYAQRSDHRPAQGAGDGDDMLATRQDDRSLNARLLRAGWAGPKARRLFLGLRATAMALGFAGLWWITRGRSDIWALPLLFGACGAAVAYVLVGVQLDRQIARNQARFRRIFPNLLDLLVVCVDSGLGLEAAIDRVAQEFTRDRSLFGQYVLLISLELRAGRPIDEAFQAFGERTAIVQARELATLFRQSQQMGTSIILSLQTYSREMRQMRMVRAEEQANGLPVKMLLPLGAFLLPVNLIIVAVPIILRIAGLFTSLSGSGGN